MELFKFILEVDVLASELVEALEKLGIYENYDVRVQDAQVKIDGKWRVVFADGTTMQRII